MTVWIVILAIAWGNPDSRVQGNVGDVIKIERVEVATEEECRQAAHDWVYHFSGDSSSGSARVFATCAGQKPAAQP